MMERVEVSEEIKVRQEANSFVLELKSILSPYGLNIHSPQGDLSRLVQKEKDYLISSISNLVKSRNINYISEKNEKVVHEVKKIVGDTFGTLIEKIAFGDNVNNETMDAVIEKTATKLSVTIEEEAFLVFKKDNISLDDKTRGIEDFIKKELERTINDNRWNPKNIRKLLNRIMDFTKDVWDGFKIKNLIFKVGKNIVEKREEEFTERGI